MKLERILGQRIGAKPGPTLIITGAIHGNEPAGALAAAAVCAAIDPAELRGEVIALGGNLGAAALGERGVEVDLNRQWTAERIQAVREGDPADDRPEQAEQRAILELLDAAIERARGPVTGLDLHTTSGGGPPFIVAGDTLPNLGLAMALPIPLILGLEESIDGTLMQFYGDRGLSAMTVETGQHADPATVGLHEGVIWLTLIAMGALDRPHVPGWRRHHRALARAAGRVPRTMELVYRHPIDSGDGFKMRPGYQGFQRVKADETLADDRAGAIRAPSAGRILMPLYQPQGSDGFFLVRDLNVASRKASHTLRKLGAERLLPFLPGVEQETPHVLRLRKRSRRAFRAAELLGYRRQRTTRGVETLSRRFTASSE